LDYRFPKAVPWKKYSGTHEGLSVHIVVPGKDFNLGTVSAPIASISSYLTFRG
jgi:hypothetical protein